MAYSPRPHTLGVLHAWFIAFLGAARECPTIIAEIIQIMWNWTETFSTVVGIRVYYSVHNSWWWWWLWVKFTLLWSRCCRYLGNSPQDLYRTYLWTSNRLALDAIILRAIRGQKRSNKAVCVCVCVQLKCEFCRLVWPVRSWHDATARNSRVRWLGPYIPMPQAYKGLCGGWYSRIEG